MPRRKYKKKEESYYSHTIARSISHIITFSVDYDFMERSFKALDVIGTKGVENKIFQKLLTSTENSKSLVSQNVTYDEESENQPVQKSKEINLPESLSHLEEKCVVLNEYRPDLSRTTFSQICSQTLRKQEQRRLREKKILLKINSRITTPKD